MIPIYNFADLSPDQILNRDIQAEADVSAAVDEILSGVREGGDEALRAYTRRFDGAEIPDLEVSPQEIEAAWSSLDPDFRSTLELAAENICPFPQSAGPPGFRGGGSARHCDGPALPPPFRGWACACPGARRPFPPLS